MIINNTNNILAYIHVYLNATGWHCWLWRLVFKNHTSLVEYIYIVSTRGVSRGGRVSLEVKSRGRHESESGSKTEETAK